MAARAPTKVNNYQWRAPGEWFAEVYAISWLSKKKPPAAEPDTDAPADPSARTPLALLEAMMRGHGLEAYALDRSPL